MFTIVILFALQGEQITSRLLDVARIALPLLAYFVVMWGGGFALGRILALGYARSTTPAFTAAGNNFELTIAVAIESSMWRSPCASVTTGRPTDAGRTRSSDD